MPYGDIRARGGIGIMIGNSGATAVGSASAGVGAPQRGSAYGPAATQPIMQRQGPPASTMLLALVGLEALALIGLRRGFRNHHGG